jgi:D-lactate dehydrogenase
MFLFIYKFKQMNSIPLRKSKSLNNRIFKTFSEKTKIAFFSSKKYDIQNFQNLNKTLDKNFELTFFETQLNKDTAVLAKGHNAVCAFVNDDIKEETLQKLKSEGINTIALRCAGYNNVDLKVAKDLKFKICRVPEYSPAAIAEHAICLILALNRRIKKSMDRIREGNFELDGLMGFDIKGKTVGVIGTGKIGTCFVNIIKGFGANVLLHDVYKNKVLEERGEKYVDLDEVYANSDIISIHSNLTNDTFHMINKETIDKMKHGVMIINVSRGAIIDTHAVIEGLKSGRIGYLGLDVVENEEHIFFRDCSDKVIVDDDIGRLLSFTNVIITGHQAFFTQEAVNSIVTVTLNNLEKIFKGEKSDNLLF